ncbi:hypothetical protein A2U01_0047361, partial [Trifolium medium]|nr:hypothetical protein [Trifolium medium]
KNWTDATTSDKASDRTSGRTDVTSSGIACRV